MKEAQAAAYFKDDPKVQELVAEYLPKLEGKIFSDVIDKDGHQYVDIVMQGGGVLGFSLVGYIYALELAGVRMMGISGTSIGSIVAMIVAAQPDYSSTKSDHLLEAIKGLDTSVLVDGSKRVKSFLKGLIRNKGRMSVVWNGTMLMNEFAGNLGLNPGKRFYYWLQDVIGKHGVHTLDDLDKVRSTFPHLNHTREGRKLEKHEIYAPLAIIATDISTETKVVFPKMASLYWEHEGRINPASFVRASMSVPFVFKPFVVKNLPNDEAARNRWKLLTNFRGNIPKKVFFTDGGIVSNFPINIFHNPQKVPLKPTFGVKMEKWRRNANNITSPFRYVRSVFNSARHALDNEFINNNKEYRQLITYIDTTGYNWLDFGIPMKDKSDLFYRGVKAGFEFLERFEWESYHKFRKRQVENLRDLGGEDV